MHERTFTLPQCERQPDGSCLIRCWDLDGEEFLIPFAHVFEAWRFADVLTAITPKPASADLGADTRQAGCGHPVSAHPGRQRSACDNCHKAAGRTPPAPRMLKIREHVCVGCDIAFTRKASGPEPTRPACSEACRAWIASGKPGFRPLVRHCEACGTDISAAPGHARYCSSFCSDVARGRRLPGPLPLLTCALPECTVQFQPKHRKQRCCSERHGKLLSHRDYRAAGKEVREAWGDSRRERYHRRRALKKQAATGKPVVFSEIAKRDRWKCGICRLPVDATLKWPHPHSSSLDHIVPLTADGEHDPANVQLAHLVCNTSKGNRGGGEQLALIG